MGYLLHSCAGRVHIVSNEGGGRGWFQFDPDIAVGTEAKVIYQSVPTNYTEIVQPTVTLDDSKFMVVFGSAWTTGQVDALVLLGDATQGGGAIAQVVDWYLENRVSVKREPLSFSMASRGVDTYLTGLRMGAINAEFHRVAVQISIHMLES